MDRKYFNVSHRKYGNVYMVWVWAEKILTHYEMQNLASRWVLIGVFKNYRDGEIYGKNFEPSEV